MERAGRSRRSDAVAALEERVAALESEVADQRRRAAALAELAGAISFSIDSEGRLDDISPEAERLFGFPRQAVLGLHFAEFVSAGEFPGAAAIFERAMNGESIAAVRLGGRHADGRFLPLEITMAPRRADDGRVTGLIGVAVDSGRMELGDAARARYIAALEERVVGLGEELRCTVEGAAEQAEKRRLALSAQRECEQRFRAATGAASDGFVVLDPDARITFVNQRTSELLGWEPADMLGRSSFDFIAVEDHARAQAARDANMRGEPRHDEIVVALTARGDSRRLLAPVVPLLGSNGQYLGSIAVLSEPAGEAGEETTARERVTAASRIAARLAAALAAGELTEAVALVAELRVALAND